MAQGSIAMSSFSFVRIQWVLWRFSQALRRHSAALLWHMCAMWHHNPYWGVTICHCIVTVEHYDCTLQHCEGTMEHWNLTTMHYGETRRNCDVTIQHFGEIIEHCNVIIQHCDIMLLHCECIEPMSSKKPMWLRPQRWEEESSRSVRLQEESLWMDLVGGTGSRSPFFCHEWTQQHSMSSSI